MNETQNIQPAVSPAPPVPESTVPVGDQTIVLGGGGQSVLHLLGQKLGEVPRVMLRDEQQDGLEPIVRSTSPEMPVDKGDSRYHLHGEIARGGMGAILKGRDSDLGRDLAIKVLLESHRHKPEVVQRFIEEAQIAGQLQHPGIVPVYEMGQFADERPYFSMKLVKGQTLTALLAERKDLADDRPRFLGIFQQICQTLAYAHSRGVIHRDLKPSNIMVGAFGEVQVMDWGLAKVMSAGGVADERRALERPADLSDVRKMPQRSSDGTPIVGSNTLAGSVLGTPAYMPPEQALGEVERLDERSDVFGLGAILCEILTGKPPYIGRDGTEVFRRATRGKLEDCHARLAACEADPELIELAKECLAAEPVDRPRHAGILAERVAGYLSSVESRLRAAEVQGAAEAARAEEALHTAQEHEAAARAERHARRLQLGLAALVIGVTTLGGASSLWSAMYQSQLKRNAQLAEQTAVSAREAESKQLQRAEAEKKRSDNMLADMQTSRGLLAGRDGDAATAALWFANAALATPHDSVRQAANRLRARNWLNDAVVPVALLKTPPGSYRRMAFQPDGSLAITLHGTSLRVWDWRYEQVLTWCQSLDSVADAGWSPDGKLLVVATDSGEVRIVDPSSGAARHGFPAMESIAVVQWAPDGKRIAVGGKSVQIWNVADKPTRESDWLHPNIAYGLTFNRSGTRLATACKDNMARVFAIDNPSLPAPLFAPVDHDPYIVGSTPSPGSTPVFCDDDRKLVTILKTKVPGWWNVETGRSETPVWTAPSSSIDRSLAVSADGRWVAGAGFRSSLIWTVSGQSTELLHPNHAQQAIFQPDGKALLTTCWDGKARLWPIPSSGHSSLAFQQMETNANCSFSPDGSLVAIVGSRQAVIWQLPQQAAIIGNIDAWTDRYYAPRPGFDGRWVTPGKRHEAPSSPGVRGNTLSVAWLANGKPAGPSIALDGSLEDSCLCADNRSVAVTCVRGSSGFLSVFDIATGAPRFSSVSLPAQPTSVSTRPKNPQVAVLCRDGQVLVFDTQDGSRKHTLTHEGSTAESLIPRVAYSPDGNSLVCLTLRNQVYVHDAETGKLRYPPLNPVLDGGPCRTWAFSRDGRWLATGVNGKNVVQVWELSTGKKVGPVLPHPGDLYGIYSLDFSPDGRHLLSGHKDGQLRLWDWQAGKLVVPPMQNPDEVFHASFSTDGRHAIAAVRSSTVHIWDLDTGKQAAAPVHYALQRGESTVALCVSGTQVVASVTGYPVIDLSLLLKEPGEETETLLRRAELATNLKQQLGELATLEQSEWNERWDAFVAARISPQAEAETLARALDESPDASARQMLASRALRMNLLDGLLKLRPDVPQLHMAMAEVLARKGDDQGASRHRQLTIQALQKPLAARMLDTSTADMLATLMAREAPSPRWTPLEPTNLKADSGCTLTQQLDGSILAGPTAKSANDTYTLRCRSPLRKIATLRLETLPHSSLPNLGQGWGGGNFHLTELRAELHRADGSIVPVKFRSAAADRVRPINSSDQTVTMFDGPWGTIDGNHGTRWDVWPYPKTPHWLALELAEPLDVANADELIVYLDFRDPRYSSARLGCFRLSVGDDAREFVNQQLIAAVRANELVGFEALAAAYLATGDAVRAAEVLQQPSGNSDNPSATSLLLLALAQRSLGKEEPAHATAGKLVSTLKEKAPPRALQQLFLEVATTLGGLDNDRFYALIKSAAVDPELARLTKEIEANPAVASKYAARGIYLARFGRWKESAGDYARELKLTPDLRICWMKVANTLLLAGEEEAYRKHCQAMVDHFRDTTDAQNADTVCKISLLLPDTVPVSDLPIGTLIEGTTNPKWEKYHHWFSANCALVSYREGKFAEAIDWTKKMPSLSSYPGALALVARAMAEEKLGQHEQAVQSLAQAEALIPEELATLGSVGHSGTLPAFESIVSHDWLVAEILRREAALLIHKVAARQPSAAELRNLALQLYQSGRRSEALVAIKKSFVLEHRHGWAHTLAGRIHLEQGANEKALQEFRLAMEISPDYAPPFLYAGLIQFENGALDDAEPLLRKALEIDPRLPLAHRYLGTLLLERSRAAEAIAVLQKAVEVNPSDSVAANLLAKAQTQKPLLDKLSGLLDGTLTPANNAERLAAAELCNDQRKYLAAARFFAKALSDDPLLADVPEKFYRYHAARAAARAAAGEGDAAKLEDAERARIRQKAIEWLQAELQAAKGRFESSDPRERQRIVLRLLGWLLDPALSGIRDPDQVAKLPENEQLLLNTFWSNLKELASRAP